MNKFKDFCSNSKQKIKNIFTPDRPISIIQIILTVLFVAALMISNIISSRIFNFFGFTMTSAVIVFPITYILSDLFSEVYGYKWSRLTCYLGFVMNLFMVVIFYLVSVLPVFDFSVDAANSFNTVLTGTFACTLASFIAFVIGDFCNDIVFAKMKKKHEGLTNHKMIVLQVLLKTAYETLILPLTTFLAKKLGNYESKQLSNFKSTVLNKEGEEK